MTNQTPAPVISARDRLVAAYVSRSSEFGKCLAEAGYDHAVAWTMFARLVCPELPHTYVLDAVDLARVALIAMKSDIRARQRIEMRFERVGA
jgi:hypothetical protein